MMTADVHVAFQDIHIDLCQGQDCFSRDKISRALILNRRIQRHRLGQLRSSDDIVQTTTLLIMAVLGCYE